MAKYLVKFVGSFFLVFTVGCTVVGNGAGALPPLAIGSVLMVMVFAAGQVSGGHYNPVVTFGVWLKGRCEAKDVAPYMISQIAGSILAALAVKYLKMRTAATPTSFDALPALLAEFLLTFALVIVVLNAATAKGRAGNSFYGVAIGFTVMSGAFAVRNISDGAFNPGGAQGISVMELAAWSNIWVYWLAEFAAGAAAAFLFKAVNPDDI